MQTLSRAIRLAVGEVLQKHDIDDLGLDIEITSSVVAILNENKTKQRSTPETLAAALVAGMAEGSLCYEYPEDVRPFAERVCKLWKLKPPRQSRKGGEFAFWLESLRELSDACGEYGADLINDLRSEYEQSMMDSGGLAPYFVTGPSSLVKSARAFAGLKRQGITGLVRRGKQAAHQTTLDV